MSPGPGLRLGTRVLGPRGLRTRGLRTAAVLLALAGFGAAAAVLGAHAFAALPVWMTLGAMALYLLAHLLRALRLGIIATPLLGTSVRSIATLHFVCAPLVTLIPMKLGELFRLQQLWVLGGRLSGAVIALLIDRLLDATMLLGLLGWYALTGRPEISGIDGVLELTAAVVGLTGVVLVLGPRMLTSLQRHVLVHHDSPALLRLLPMIDMLRRGAEEGSRFLGRQGGPLLVITAGIWLLELAAAALFVSAVADPALRDPGLLLLSRLTQEWQIATGAGIEPAFAASAASGILALLAVWPLAVWLYLRRIAAAPPPRRRLPQPSEVHHDA